MRDRFADGCVGPGQARAARPRRRKRLEPSRFAQFTSRDSADRQSQATGVRSHERHSRIPHLPSLSRPPASRCGASRSSWGT